MTGDLDDFDDLLQSLSEEETPEEETPEEETPEEETPEEETTSSFETLIDTPLPSQVELLERIASLEAKIEALSGGATSTPEDGEVVIPNDRSSDAIVIHVLEDGLSALGDIRYRGETLRFARGGAEYADTVDRFGHSWVDDADDVQAQIARWGRRLIAPGEFDPAMSPAPTGVADIAPFRPNRVIVPFGRE